MIYNLYAIQDRLTGLLTPTAEPSDAVAQRNFAHAVLNGGSLMLSHPEDYFLVRIGTYDTNQGIVATVNPPEVIVSATSIAYKEVSKNAAV